MNNAQNISEPKKTLLKVLARLHFATVPQLAYWHKDCHESRIYDHLNQLIKLDLVEVYKAKKPYIYSPTRNGFRAGGLTPPRGSRNYTWSVMTHRVHLNESEIKLRKHYPEFKFLPRKNTIKYGVNPSFCEHYGMGNGKRIMMLLDDYLMDSKKIKQTLERDHKPDPRFFDIKKSKINKWPEISDIYVVGSIDEQQYENHKAFIMKHKIEAKLLKVPTFWG